jgi:hypothetical protein
VLVLGKAERFRCGKQVGSYIGLIPSEESSGGRQRLGHAILNAARLGIAVQGATIYVTKFPCLACCHSIIQAGIKRVYTLDKWYWDDDPFDGKPDETKNRDGDHWRKRRAIRQTHLITDAPNHPEYTATNPDKKKPPMRATDVDPKTGSGTNGD